MNRHPLVQKLRDLFLFLLGNGLLAFAVAAFVIPSGVITGGATGIGLLVSRLLAVDAALVVLVFNLAMLVLGGIVLGRKFVVSTVAASLLYPALLGVFQRIPGVTEITDDRLLATLFAGGLIGLSVGILVRIGSSTGGTDVLNLVVNKWTHIPFSTVAACTDLVILTTQAFFVDAESILFGLLLLAVLTAVLNSVMIMGKDQLQVFVISPEYEQIRSRLLNEVEVGVTLLSLETGYQRQEQKGVMCILPKRRLHAVHQLVMSVDPNAFMTVTQIKEVQGEGFSRARHQRIEPDGTGSENK